MGELEDDQLVARAQAGDEAAFAVLYRRHHGRVVAAVRLALRDDHAVEDIVQQTFITAFERLHTYEMRDEPAWPWILGIARNLARNHLRKRNQGQAIPLEAIEELVVSDFDAAFADVISRDSVQTMMAELTPAQRQVVGLRHVLGLRFIEIANLTGRTSPAVRKLHQRAIEVLKPGLETTPTEQGRTRSTRTPVRILMRKSPTLRTRRFALARELGTRMLPR